MATFAERRRIGREAQSVSIGERVRRLLRIGEGEDDPERGRTVARAQEEIAATRDETDRMVAKLAQIETGNFVEDALVGKRRRDKERGASR